MEVVLSILLGWFSIWFLYAVWVWVFHTRLNQLALMLLFGAHWGVYTGLYQTGIAAHASTGTAIGWFLVGPILGGLWLTLRRVGVGTRQPSLIGIALTTGLLNLLVTTGVAVPVFLGMIYVTLILLGVL